MKEKNSKKNISNPWKKLIKLVGAEEAPIIYSIYSSDYHSDCFDSLLKHSGDCLEQVKELANTIISLVGEPIFALGVGTIIAIYGLVRKEDNKKVIGIMDDSNQRYRYYHADHRSRRFSWKCNQSQRYRRCTWCRPL